MPTLKLNDKVALVTGASRGIGAAIARRLARDGARVLVNYNSSADQANTVVADIAQNGGSAVALQADVSDPDQIIKLFDDAENAFGPVDLLVNNAGILKSIPAPQIDAAAYEQTFGANIRGPILCMAEFAKRLDGKPGNIVNISSSQSRSPRPASSLYVATKGALEAATRAFAVDLGASGVRVNALAPGAVLTDTFVEAVPESARDQMSHATPLGRLATPEDVADATSLLLNDDARWINGQIIDATGGL